METGLREQMKQELELQEVDVHSYSPLALAYIGDAVYELLIRTKVMNHGSMQVNKMHKKTASLVQAKAQADMIKALMEELTEEETVIFKRGRNAKSVTAAKHATISDYRMATGCEALMGYLYLTGQTERLLRLVHDGLEKMGELSCDTKNLP
ncbi:MAG: ribonuclease III [Clostridiales bacterium]|nr:ribonuclease III [Clostridiales bacterium]